MSIEWEFNWDKSILYLKCKWFFLLNQSANTHHFEQQSKNSLSGKVLWSIKLHLAMVPITLHYKSLSFKIRYRIKSGIRTMPFLHKDATAYNVTGNFSFRIQMLSSPLVLDDQITSPNFYLISTLLHYGLIIYCTMYTFLEYRKKNVPFFFFLIQRMTPKR